MASRHTTVEITSAEIKNLSSVLERARDVMAEWQTSHSQWYDLCDEPDAHYTALAGVLGAIESVKALEKQLWKQHSRKEIKHPGENVGKISDWLAERNFKAQRAFETQLDRDLDKQLDKADAIGRANGVQRSPTVAELREHGKHEPAWVQEASAYHRSRDPGEFSDERRAQMEGNTAIAEKFHVSREQLNQPISTLRQYEALTPTERDDLSNHYGGIRGLSAMTPREIDALSKEHAKPEAMRELERDDGYEIGM